MSNIFTALKHKLLQKPSRGFNQMPKTTFPDFYQNPLDLLPWQQHGFPGNRNHPPWQQQRFLSNRNPPHDYSSAGFALKDYVRQQCPNLKPNNFVSKHFDYQINS